MKSPELLPASFLLASFLLLLTSCSQPNPPSTESMPNDAFKEFFPKLVQANKVAILCWSPERNDQTDKFTKSACEGLADRIRNEGFRRLAILDGTPATSVEPVSVEEVSVFYTPSDLDRDAQDAYDVRIHLQLDDHSLEGIFEKNEVSMQSSYSATLWIYGNDSDHPFRTSWSGSSKKTAAGETPLEETPGWSIYGYPEDEAERINQFAKECGAGTLDAINQFGTSDPDR